MPDVSEVLKSATEILRASGIAEPRREASSLLAFALNKDKTFLITHPERDLSGEEEKGFQELLERRAAREPFQYITRKQEFYGLDFIVTPDVLIPRPETELIVENAVEILRNIENPRFCEIGVGSGCISVAILHEVETVRAVGLDISESATKIAAENAEKHAISQRLELRISDVFSNLPAQNFDLIVSNPPYIPNADLPELQPEVRDFEPRAALTDGKNGLSIIEKIVAESPRFLKSNGFLLVEIGIHQAKLVSEMFDERVWQSHEFLPDLQGIPRTVKARLYKQL